MRSESGFNLAMASQPVEERAFPDSEPSEKFSHVYFHLQPNCYIHCLWEVYT